MVGRAGAGKYLSVKALNLRVKQRAGKRIVSLIAGGECRSLPKKRCADKHLGQIGRAKELRFILPYYVFDKVPPFRDNSEQLLLQIVFPITPIGHRPREQTLPLPAVIRMQGVGEFMGDDVVDQVR